MSHEPSISLAELDTDLIKSAFVDFLKTQPVFKDYEYTGANINVLLDLLSKNTYFNTFLLNMVANEAFLDSAQLRNSIASKAKELGYLPRSWRSAEALLNIEITAANTLPTIVTIPSGTAFTSRIDDQVFTFTTSEAISSVPTSYVSATNAYVYAFENVSIFEGELVTETFLVDNDQSNQKFVLSNKQVDTRSIKVTVAASNSAVTNTSYTLEQSLKGLNSDSTAFFVEPAQDDKYAILFGDGVIGVKPNIGNIITATYRATHGADANNSKTFTLISDNIGGYTNFTIDTADIARSGSEQETDESIKFNAPRHYQTQENAIVANDYSILLREEFPEIRAIHVYGGDEINPPRYGTVLMAVDLQNFDGIPSYKRSAIESYIKNKMPITFIPEIVEPEYLYVDITLDAEYSLNLTTKSVDDVKTEIVSAITSFNDINLDNFNKKFRYANLNTAINESDTSITGTNLSIKLYKQILPVLEQAYSASLFYQNELTPSTITSTSFTYNGISAFLADDGLGSIKIYTMNGSTSTAVSGSIGAVSYTTGEIILSGLLVSQYTGDSIRLYAETVKQDISSSQNSILSIGIENMSIAVTAVRA